MPLLVILMIPLAVIAMLIHTFLFEPFDTPSTSMAPTLVFGDQFLASKFAYGYSRYSFPFSPALFSGRMLGGKPVYGDIVVFRLPKDDSTDYIKRVVGLPGDRVQMKAGQLYINGKAVERERVYADDTCPGSRGEEKRWQERLPNGVTYETLDCLEDSFYDDTQEYQVPAGHYFMMGDNRDNSNDSRVLSTVGFVPYENLIGRFVWKYLDGEAED
jgi:signal peptidase I